MHQFRLAKAVDVEMIHVELVLRVRGWSQDDDDHIDYFRLLQARVAIDVHGVSAHGLN